MNQYGRRAQQHWQEFQPGGIAEIDHLEAFLTKLLVDVGDNTRIHWTGQRLSAPDAAGESCLERAGCLQHLRHHAKGELLCQLVRLPTEHHIALADDPHLGQSEVGDEQWPDHHLYDLLGGLRAFSGALRERPRAGAVPHLLELIGLSNEALARQGPLWVVAHEFFHPEDLNEQALTLAMPLLETEPAVLWILRQIQSEKEKAINPEQRVRAWWLWWANRPVVRRLCVEHWGENV
ncbi:hypothetical protein [Streptomyces sp. NPDC059783]|uniref:hypothetical protein n=1 Tax=Streptomyces sp. NPDC059783 TaxID=3346944 RepID=UPI003648261A